MSGTSVSGYSRDRAASGSVLRAAATTRSPAARAASVNALPSPREAPVMNQTLAVVMQSHFLQLLETRRFVSLRFSLQARTALVNTKRSVSLKC